MVTGHITGSGAGQQGLADENGAQCQVRQKYCWFTQNKRKKNARAQRFVGIGTNKYDD